MAGVVELSGSVIESPQGLHSNTYKFSVKARLIVWKIIGLPQTGQATSLLGVKSSLIGALCTQWWSATLTRINTSAKRRSALQITSPDIHLVDVDVDYARGSEGCNRLVAAAAKVSK
jgi:hypothetical protein